MTPIRKLASALVFVALSGSLTADEGRLEIRTIDKASGQPVAARMHLKNPKGQPVKPPKVPFWKDHFVFDGTIVLELPLGTYTFEIECEDGSFAERTDVGVKLLSKPIALLAR